MFDKFQDYLFSLLSSPLQKGSKVTNQFYILFKVFGKLLDRTKQDIFRVRAESMIMTASEIMLVEHGIDRDMPRLKGESVENYRMRLAMKSEIAERAGMDEGIRLAVRALGYESAYTEPYYIHDPERWAEFIVYLSSSEQSGVNDIAIIDREVMKVKPARSKPNYGIGADHNLIIKSQVDIYEFEYPICNVLICGTQ